MTDIGSELWQCFRNDHADFETNKTRLDARPISDLNKQDEFGTNLIMFAISHPDSAVHPISRIRTNACNFLTEYCIGRGVYLNSVDMYGNRALEYGAANPLLDAGILRRIFEGTTDPHKANHFGQNALMLALGAGQSRGKIAYLMGKYESLADFDREGNNYLHYAMKGLQPPEVLKMLLERGVSVNATNVHGSTPYMLGVNYLPHARGQLISLDFRHLTFLRNNGADLNIPDATGKTAVDMLINPRGGNSFYDSVSLARSVSGVHNHTIIHSSKYENNLLLLKTILSEDSAARPGRVCLSQSTLEQARTKAEAIISSDGIEMCEVLSGAIVASAARTSAAGGAVADALPAGAAGGAAAEAAPSEGVGAHTLLTVPNTQSWREIFSTPSVATHATRLTTEPQNPGHSHH